MNNGVTDRDFGRLEAEVMAVKAQNAEMKTEMRILRDDVRKLVDALSEARGGYKVLFAIGASSAAVGASAVKFIAFLKGG